MNQHIRFLGRLADSWPAVFAVALNQHKKGRYVGIPPTRYAPTAAKAQEYVDDGDLIVDGRRMEVKHLGVNFTNENDWPFNEVFVSNVASVDRSVGVLAYVSVSQDLKHAAVVHRKSKPHWCVIERLAKNTGNVEKFYACPIEHVLFEEL